MWYLICFVGVVVVVLVYVAECLDAIDKEQKRIDDKAE